MERSNYGLGLSESYLDSESNIFRTLEHSDKSLGLSFPFIPKLTYPNIHYRCPKCFFFPIN